MTHKSKSIITSMVTSVLIFVAYVIYAIDKDRQGPEESLTLKSWALTMLVFVGISIIALIVVQIIFRIALAVGIAAKHAGDDSVQVERILSSSMVEDEMDKIVALKSARVGYICAGIGFLGALVALALGGSAVLALHIMLGSFALGSLAEGAVSIYGYERGVSNG